VTVARITSTEMLDDLLSEPSAPVVDAMRRARGDLIVLGAGGKMGPTLARMARRAIDSAGVPRRVIAVSRFSTRGLRDAFEQYGIATIACDLLDRRSVAALPDAADVVFMAGMKFGASGQPSLTWAENCFMPALVCERYRESRIAAFSTGNVYPLVRAGSGGSRESDDPAPAGEYAMSCLGRERMFEHFSRTNGTRLAIIRLNYACELRYGVLVDIARRVLAGEAVDVTMGYLNAIWQGDANAMALCSLDHAASPPFVINVAGADELRVREVASTFGRLLERPVRLTGAEAPDALLSNGRRAIELFGPPRVGTEQLMDWIADWQLAGRETLGKPTKFEVRDGKF
jgi:nucleoside-diphosphate-sugar epimerase